MRRIGAQTPSASYSEVDLLKSWCARTRVVEKAHFRRCAAFRRNHYILGGVLIGASALTSALTALVEEGNSLFEEYALAIFLARLVLALFVPVCAALATFLSYEARSARHHDAAARFAALKRRMSRALVIAEIDRDTKHARDELEAVAQDWDRLTHDAPALYRKRWESEISRYERSLGLGDETSGDRSRPIAA